MTLRTNITNVYNILASHAVELMVDTDDIKYGTVGEMPTGTPFILLYYTPKGSVHTNNLANLIADVTIFCGDSASEPNDARLKSLELAERVMQVVNKYQGILIQHPKVFFDAEYSDYSVSGVEFSVYYNPSPLY